MLLSHLRRSPDVVACRWAQKYESRPSGAMTERALIGPGPRPHGMCPARTGRSSDRLRGPSSKGPGGRRLSPRDRPCARTARTHGMTSGSRARACCPVAEVSTARHVAGAPDRLRAVPRAKRFHGTTRAISASARSGCGTCSSTSSPTTRSMLASTNGISRRVAEEHRHLDLVPLLERGWCRAGRGRRRLRPGSARRGVR